VPNCSPSPQINAGLPSAAIFDSHEATSILAQLHVENRVMVTSAGEVRFV
jgi:hypothetical protein